MYIDTTTCILTCKIYIHTYKHTCMHTCFRKYVTLLTFLNEISDRHGGVDRWSAVVVPGVCIIEAASAQVAVQGQGGGPRTRLLACERGDDK